MTADSDGKALLLLCCYAFDTRAGAWPRDVAAHTHGMFRRKRATGVTQKLPTTVWKRTVASRGRVDAVVTVMPASVIVSIDTFTLTAWRQKGSGDSQMRTLLFSVHHGMRPGRYFTPRRCSSESSLTSHRKGGQIPYGGSRPEATWTNQLNQWYGTSLFRSIAGLSGSPTSDLVATDRCFDDDLEATVACHRSTSNPEGLYAAFRALWQTSNCLRWKSSRETTTTIIATTTQAADEEDDKDNLG